MKKLFLGLYIGFFPAVVFAQTPSETAMTYINHLHFREYEKAVEYIDVGELRVFRENLGFYETLLESEQAKFLKVFFGPEATPDSVASMSDERFFASFLAFSFRNIEAMGELNFKNTKILGGVPEGNDMMHLVVRSGASLDDISISGMEVMSLRKGSDNIWRLMMTGSIKGLSSKIRTAFGH